jgi:hypothetical protein
MEESLINKQEQVQQNRTIKLEEIIRIIKLD